MIWGKEGEIGFDEAGPPFFQLGFARLAKEAILGPILGENVPLGGCVRISSEGFGGKQYG